MKRHARAHNAFSLDNRIKTADLLLWILDRKWIQLLLLLANAGVVFFLSHAQLTLSGVASSLFYGFLFALLELLLLAVSIMAEIPAEMIADALFPRETRR